MLTENPPPDWRPLVTKPCSALKVGRFRPTQRLTTSCFGEIRVAKAGQDWPKFKGRPLWPVCQLNLLDAPFVPPNLVGIAMIQVFVSDEYWSSDALIVDTDETTPNSPIVIRIYETLDGLQAFTPPDYASPYIPFESQWTEQPQIDYPTHDTMPIDFDALGVGDF